MSRSLMHTYDMDPFGGSPLRQGYGSYGNFGIGDPIDPRNYPGTVIGVDYVVHEPGWSPGGMPAPPYQPQRSLSYPHTTPYPAVPYPANPASVVRVVESPVTLVVPRSYPNHVTRYEDRYDGPPRYTPPPPPPRYEPPPFHHYVPPSPPPRPPHIDPFPHPQPHPAPHPPNPYPSPPPPKPIVPTPPHTVYPDEDPNFRPWFGVAVKWLDDLDQGGRNNVAVVHEVIPDSPAWKAGIQPEDQLEYWEATKLDSEAVWKSKISSMRINDVVNMGIHRNHRDQRVLVRIEGTHREKGGKRAVHSSNIVHTDN